MGAVVGVEAGCRQNPGQMHWILKLELHHGGECGEICCTSLTCGCIDRFESHDDQVLDNYGGDVGH